MTQSPRRSERPDGLTSPQPQDQQQQQGGDTSRSSAGDLSETSTDKRSSGLLDTLFSPVFTFFGTKQEGDPAAAAAAAASAAAAAEAEALATARAQAEAEALATARAQAAAQQRAQQAKQQQQQQDDDGELEFDPYAFIRTLPPYPPPLTRPVCLPKKTRGTSPISLVLDLDETLLHSSIVPLPT